MGIFSKDTILFKKQLSNLKKIQNLAVCGMFIALYIVLSYFNIKITVNIEIRFAFLVLAMSGCYGGPAMGLIVGAASDVLSMLMTSGQGSAFFFGFTVSYALLGFLFGLCFYKNKISPVSVGVAAIFNFIVGTTLNTVWLYMMYGMPLKALAVTRLIKEAVMLPLNFVMLFIVLRVLVQVVAKAGFMEVRSA